MLMYIVMIIVSFATNQPLAGHSFKLRKEHCSVNSRFKMSCAAFNQYYFTTYFHSPMSTLVSGLEYRVVFHCRQLIGTDNCHRHVCIYIFARLLLMMFTEHIAAGHCKF